jgi:GMP synthase (glutamine-hydrolysing)
MIAVIDFGGQTTHLISRRLREISIENFISEPEDFFSKAKGKNLKGIIFSGGPESVYAKNAPTIDKKIFTLGKNGKNIPMLGICYGQQLIAHLLGGEVKPGHKKEFGPATITLKNKSALFHFPKEFVLPESFTVWMSHGDEVKKAPKGFISTATSSQIPYAGMADEKNKIYGVQFHPEVIHTKFGEQMLKNFALVCGLKPVRHKIDASFVKDIVKDIKDSLKDEKAICALSGGVDSSVAAALVHEAIGKNLTSIYIDSGLMRHNETVELRKVFIEHHKMNVKIINAKKIFLTNLKGVTDPEKKRKIIGKTFIDVFEREAAKLKAKFLVQGTIYPDVIESSDSKHSHKIKSHHNVGGLPKNMKLVLIEPLRIFYKDEVRQIGKFVDLPDSILHRHPFPGPGLAVRIIGDITEYKLKILRQADLIVQEELRKNKLDADLWQAFAVFTGVKSTGVKGDARVYGETIAIRAVHAKDAMTAHFSHLPYEVLNKISVRIVNEIKEVNRVVYDITNKPPGTIEWE